MTQGITDSPTQQILDQAKGVEAFRGYSASPCPEEKRPNFERSVYMPRAVPFNQILELWAAHEGGSLASVLPVRPGDDGKPGEDVARRAWEWVSITPGWNKVVHEVMRHLVLRAKSWDQWPIAYWERSHRQKGVVAQYCVWPAFGIPKEVAGENWQPFYRNLRRHYREDPFTINEQFFESR